MDTPPTHKYYLAFLLEVLAALGGDVEKGSLDTGGVLF
jgi:hypothetical protein